MTMPLLDVKYAGKFEPSPGHFHITVCAIWCLGVTVEGSRLDTAWVDAELYSSVTVMQILQGKHYKRAIECHMITWQGFHVM